MSAKLSPAFSTTSVLVTTARAINSCLRFEVSDPTMRKLPCFTLRLSTLESPLGRAASYSTISHRANFWTSASVLKDTGYKRRHSPSGDSPAQQTSSPCFSPTRGAAFTKIVVRSVPNPIANILFPALIEPVNVLPLFRKRFQVLSQQLFDGSGCDLLQSTSYKRCAHPQLPSPIQGQSEPHLLSCAKKISAQTRKNHRDEQLLYRA